MERCRRVLVRRVIRARVLSVQRGAMFRRADVAGIQTGGRVNVFIFVWRHARA